MNTQNTNEIDIRKIVKLVLGKWYWFVIGIVVCLGLGVLYMLRTTTKVTTEASIMLRQKDEGLGAGRFDQLEMLGIGSNKMAEDELVVLTSKDLMLQVIEKLNLWDVYMIKEKMRWEVEYPNPTFRLECVKLTDEAANGAFVLNIKQTKRGYKVAYKMGMTKSGSVEVSSLAEPIELPIGRIRLTQNGEFGRGASYRIYHRSAGPAIAYYSSLTKIAQHKKESNIFDMSITSTAPARDRDMLHTMIDMYNENALIDKNMIATNTEAFIASRLEIISRELSDAESAVEQYKTEHNMADLTEEAKLLLKAGVDEQAQLVEIETQLSLVDYISDFLKNKDNQYSLLPSNISVDDPTLAKFIGEYNELLLQRMRLERTASESSPVVEQINAQLATMRENVETSVVTVRKGLLISKAGVEERNNEVFERLQQVPKQEREYIRLYRQRALKESLYTLLYQKREENALMLAATTSPTKTIDVPRTNEETRRPKAKQIILLALIMGLLLPSGLLYVYMLFDNKIRDVKEFEQMIHAPYMGQIVANSRGKHIAIKDGESTVSAELFRLLRTNLRFVLPVSAKSSVVLVTSCINGEGKSYISTNIALSLAILGKKVALVGLDIRKPMLAKYFNLSKGGCLTSYLVEPEYTVDDVIIPGVEHPNLDLIPCGVVPPNPSELLQSERLDELFAALRERYDYIIVDTAPCAMVSDTFLLDRVTDMTLFVSRADYTPKEMVGFINQIVDSKRMKNVACVLNAVKSAHAGYGYGYGYGSKNKS